MPCAGVSSACFQNDTRCRITSGLVFGSKISRIVYWKYWDSAYYCSWAGNRLVIMGDGRYLGGKGENSDVDYICGLPLHDVPRAKWRAAITLDLEGMTSFRPVSWFPWGDELWMGKFAPATFVKNRFNAGGDSWIMTPAARTASMRAGSSQEANASCPYTRVHATSPGGSPTPPS